MIRPEQCRAARGLLKWTQKDLAHAAHVSKDTVRDFELEKKSPNDATLIVIQQSFERAGVEFIETPAPGLCLHRR